MKNAFDGLIIKLDMAQERISELENKSIEMSQPVKQRLKKNGMEYQRTVGQLQKMDYTYF